MALFLLTQWLFSGFLISPSAQNWFFAGDRIWGYREASGDWHGEFWSETWPERHPPLTARSFLVALALSIGASRVGLWLGNWMAKVRR